MVLHGANGFPDTDSRLPSLPRPLGCVGAFRNEPGHPAARYRGICALAAPAWPPASGEPPGGQRGPGLLPSPLRPRWPLECLRDVSPGSCKPHSQPIYLQLRANLVLFPKQRP